MGHLYTVGYYLAMKNVSMLVAAWIEPEVLIVSIIKQA